jgi:hypothetical protein
MNATDPLTILILAVVLRTLERPKIVSDSGYASRRLYRDALSV